MKKIVLFKYSKSNFIALRTGPLVIATQKSLVTNRVFQTFVISFGNSTVFVVMALYFKRNIIQTFVC